MKKAILCFLLMIIFISLITLGTACKDQAEADETAEEAETPEEESGQPQDAAEEGPEEEVQEESGEEEAQEVDVEGQKMIEWSLESNMGELIDNPDTRAILEKYIPEIVNSDRIDESRPYSLSLVLSFADVDDEIPAQIDEELKNLGDGIGVMEGADEIVSYTVSFKATWSIDTHPDNYVSNAHFSPFVIYAYNGAEKGRIYIEGETSTPGMEDMAETGATDMLEEEINQIIIERNAINYVKARSFDTPGQTEETLEFTPEFSSFIFVSMIAPSPDWFVAAEGDVFEDGQWVDELVLDVISFDAGTDSGETLTAANSDTVPKEPIAVFEGYLQALGTLTLTRN